MLVSEIVALYRPVYPEGGTWQDTVNYLYETEPSHMESLYEAIQTEGIREPVLLSDYDDEPEQFVLDGTHRVALALRKGIVSLPTLLKSDQEVEYGSSLIAFLEIAEGLPLTSAQEDQFFDTVRSWRLDDSHWLTSSGASGGSGHWELYLDSSDETIAEACEERLREILFERFPKVTFIVKVKLQDPEDF